MEARIDQSTWEGQTVKGIPGSRWSIVAIDRALKRRRTSATRREVPESHPEGPSVGKEEDTEVTYTCICALAGNQRPRSGAVKSTKDSKTTLSFFITVVGKLMTSRSLSRPAERKRNSFERRRRGRVLGVRSSKRFAKIVRPHGISLTAFTDVHFIITARQGIIFKLHGRSIGVFFCAVRCWSKEQLGRRTKKGAELAFENRSVKTSRFLDWKSCCEGIRKKLKRQGGRIPETDRNTVNE